MAEDERGAENKVAVPSVSVVVHYDWGQIDGG